MTYQPRWQETAEGVRWDAAVEDMLWAAWCSGRRVPGYLERYRPQWGDPCPGDC